MDTHNSGKKRERTPDTNGARDRQGVGDLVEERRGSDYIAGEEVVSSCTSTGIERRERDSRRMD